MHVHINTQEVKKKSFYTELETIAVWVKIQMGSINVYGTANIWLQTIYPLRILALLIVYHAMANKAIEMCN